MTKKLALLLMGTTLLVSTTGCCGWPFGYGYGSGYGSGYGAGYGTGYGYGGGCPGGNCGVQPGFAPGTIQQQGAYYSPQSAIQTTTPIPGPIASPAFGSPYPATALGPMQSLPTY